MSSKNSVSAPTPVLRKLKKNKTKQFGAITYFSCKKCGAFLKSFFFTASARRLGVAYLRNTFRLVTKYNKKRRLPFLATDLRVFDHSQPELQTLRPRPRRLPLTPPPRGAPSEVPAVQALYLATGQPGAADAQVAVPRHLPAPRRLERRRRGGSGHDGRQQVALAPRHAPAQKAK